MALAVCNGATMQCSFGLAPSTLMVLPENLTLVSNQPMATIMDNKPMVNILPFGMCNTISNPVVAAATAAKLGVFTPAACIPNTVAPWAPGSPTVLVANKPALNSTSKLMCMWGGVIQILNPGQFQAQVP
jgi:hypothetical protein